MLEVAGGLGDDFEEIVFIASGVVDFEDAFEFDDLFEEVGAAGGSIEDHGDESGEGVAGEFGVETSGITEDGSAFFEAVDAVGGGRGIADELGEFGPGGAGVLDESAQKFRIQSRDNFHLSNR